MGLIIDGINMLAWSRNLSRFVGLTSKYVSNAKNFNKLKLTPQLQYIANTLRSQTVFGLPTLHEILYQMTGIPPLSPKEMGNELIEVQAGGPKLYEQVFSCSKLTRPTKPEK